MQSSINEIHPNPDSEATTKNEKLEAQRRWFEITLASIGDGVITADVEGRITFLNPVAEALTGWTKAEAVGKPIEQVFNIVNEETHAAVENPALRAIREGIVFGLANHTVLISKSGKEVYIDDSGAPIKTDDGKLLGSVLVFRDVGERRLAEEARALLAGIVDSSEDAIISKNLDGVVTSWNAAAERMFGYSAAEAVSQPITIIIPIERLGEETMILGRLRSGERIDHFETVRQTKNGEYLNISLTVSPVRNSRGEIIGASKIARNITDRVRSEQERARLLANEQAARERAEEASRAKDEFMSLISHEIRSPLNSILGWAQILRTGSLDRESTTRALESIERNARAQVQLLSDLLDISRVVTGKLKIEARPVDVAVSLEAALDSIRPAAKAKAITIDVSGVRGGLVTGDANRLQQIFWNLLSNAVKFTPARGKIEVATRRFDSQLEISVTDSGIGIPEEFLPFVFDRFTQADSGIARKHSGLGLGLSIVRHLIELHGGSVDAQSAGVNQGATFFVRLPLRPVKDQQEEYSVRERFQAVGEFAQHIEFNGLRIMIVDDELEARHLLATILGTHGAEIKTFASAAEALNMIDEWKPDILISDISMPEQDGYSFIRQVRSLKSDRHLIPAIALTAYARTEDRLRVLAAGFQMHVPKPVEVTELLMVIASLTNRNLHRN